MNGEKIIRIMQQVSNPITSEVTDLIFGEVTSISPLKIKIQNGLELTEEFIILSQLVKQCTLNLSTLITPEVVTPAILWRGLIIGDKVKMLRINKGQRYYILERDGELGL
jgi:hypothetical protein